MLRKRRYNANEPVPSLDQLCDEVLARCDALAACSDDATGITRTFLSPATHAAHGLIRDWMTDAGLTVYVDAIGNVIGRRGNPSHLAKVFAVGSHIDTVPNAGKFDGVLGVMLGIAAAKALKDESFQVGLDVIAFSEEEGVRFRTPYLGSRVVCGSFDPAFLKLTDADGISLEEAVCNFGLDACAIHDAAYADDQLVGYLEPHIEQGPVLESLDLGLGVVTSIVGQSRNWISFRGQARHAGTQPMAMRHDALAAAAEFVSQVAPTALNMKGACATVGCLHVHPNAVNVIPGLVRLSLDVRHETDAIRHRLDQQLLTAACEIGRVRGVRVQVESLMNEAAVPCDLALSERLAAAVAATGKNEFRLVSGAGHDAAIMANRCPVAMLFVRSPGGISHHPDESVRSEDVRAALAVLVQFLNSELNREQ